MGHSIQTYTYKLNVDKRRVEAELNEMVRHETYQEGGSGLPGAIKWLNVTCNSYAEAIDYIESIDTGWYNQIAVMYRKEPNAKQPKKIENLREKYNETRKKYNELNNKVAFAEFKSEYVGCKGCGSKLSTKHLKRNNCPLCNHDLRSATTLSSLQKLKEKGMQLEAQLKQETDIFVTNNVNKCEVCWLVKIEYHV